EAQDFLDHGELRPDGHGGNHFSLLPFLHRAELRVQPVVRGQQHRDAAYRRHDELDRAADRRDPTGQRPAAGAGDVLPGGMEPAHRRRAAGALRHARSERHHGLGGRLAAAKGKMMAAALLEVEGVTKRFGGFTALESVDFVVRTGERVAEEAMRILGEVGLAGRAHAMSGGLTQVDMRKLELARAMAAKPKLLISDEAMAGLSASEVDDVLALLFGLKDQGVAVIMIEHVMRAVMKFSERIAVLVAGRKIADGDPQVVVGNADVIKAYLGE